MDKKKLWIINHYATSMYFDRGGRHFWFAKYLSLKGFEPIIICANTLHNTAEYVDTQGKKYVVKKLYEEISPPCPPHKCGGGMISPHIYGGGRGGENIPFIFVKTISATKNGIRRLCNMLIFYFNLFSVSKSLIKEFGKPDIILASSVHPLTLVAGIKIAKKLKIPCICEVRDLWPEVIFEYIQSEFGVRIDKPPPRSMSGGGRGGQDSKIGSRIKIFLYKNLEKSLFGHLLVKGEYWIYKKADGLIFTKEGDIDYLKEKKWDKGSGGEVDLSKVIYINNFAPPMKYEWGGKGGEFKVVYTGSIRLINDLERIVKVAYILRDYDDIKIMIYGDGNQREVLVKRIIEMDLKNIVFFGAVKREDIPSVLKEASICLLHYKQTDYYKKRGDSSNKLFEYMAAGKPILSTVKVAFSNILKYNCGIEIENASPQEIADAILWFKNMPKEEYDMYAGNSLKAAKDFDMEILADKLKDFIASF